MNPKGWVVYECDIRRPIRMLGKPHCVFVGTRGQAVAYAKSRSSSDVCMLVETEPNDAIVVARLDDPEDQFDQGDLRYCGD